MKNDIKTKKDIEFLVNNFYDLIKHNELLYPFFYEAVAIDWNHHLPHMVSFWETVLLGNPTFEGWPMKTHLLLNKKMPLKEEHFEEWTKLWFELIDNNFEGPVALEAKNRAKIMQKLILFKIDQQKDNNLIY